MREKTIEEKAQELIDQGYFQVSRKFGYLAKIPDGKTPWEAMQEAHPYDARMMWEAFQDHVRAQYLRVYAPKECKLVIDEVLMAEFRRRGGEVA